MSLSDSRPLSLVMVIVFSLLNRVILSGVLLRLSNHALNVALGQPTLVVGDGDRVLAPAGFVFGGHVHHTVCIKIKRHLNLRHATRSWWNTVQVELTQLVVVLCQLSFALENLNEHTGLVVLVRGECLLLLRRDG